MDSRISLPHNRFENTMRIFGRMPQSLTETPGDRSVLGLPSPTGPSTMAIEKRPDAGMSAGATLRTEPRHVKVPYINERKKYDLIIAASGQVVYDYDLTIAISSGAAAWNGSWDTSERRWAVSMNGRR